MLDGRTASIRKLFKKLRLLHELLHAPCEFSTEFGGTKMPLALTGSPEESPRYLWPQRVPAWPSLPEAHLGSPLVDYSKQKCQGIEERFVISNLTDQLNFRFALHFADEIG